MDDIRRRIKDRINTLLIEEGSVKPLHESERILDSQLDSFGLTMLFLALDDEFNYFKDIPEENDPYKTIDWNTITMKDVIDKCILMSTTT
jgi:acyl carrier protein